MNDRPRRALKLEFLAPAAARFKTQYFRNSRVLPRRLGEGLRRVCANQKRWQNAIKDKAFNLIRRQVIIETKDEHLLSTIQSGTVSANVFLRKLHNFRLDMNWLPWPLIAKRQWPVIRFKEKRAITLAEHQQNLAREKNPERKAYYQMAWHSGASQTDLAFLQADDIDWENRTIGYLRRKTKSRRFSELRRSTGPCFPTCGRCGMPTAARNSGSGAWAWESQVSRCIPTATPGRRLLWNVPHFRAFLASVRHTATGSDCGEYVRVIVGWRSAGGSIPLSAIGNKSRMSL